MLEMKAKICRSGSYTPSTLPDGNKREKNNKCGATIEKKGKELKCPILVRF